MLIPGAIHAGECKKRKKLKWVCHTADESEQEESMQVSAGSASTADRCAYSPGTTGGVTSLTDEEKREVEELKTRDAEVRAHEQAHVAAGGAFVQGGASFSYETGPDGKRYAVSGEVQIDTAEVKGDPRATIRKMNQVRKAALAPANPSAQDRSVAATASRKLVNAQRELAQEQSGQPAGESSGGGGYTEKGCHTAAREPSAIIDCCA